MLYLCNVIKVLKNKQFFLMETYLVEYKNTKGENCVSEWINDFYNLQIFMNQLIGFTFSAKVRKFENSKCIGISSVFADTENNIWIKK